MAPARDGRPNCGRLNRALRLGPTVGLAALALAGLVLAAQPARAGDVTWSNGSGNFTWDTTSINWSGVAWNNATFDGAIFGGTGAGTITVGEPITVRSISFTPSATRSTAPAP